jgi:hypothetical protein
MRTLFFVGAAVLALAGASVNAVRRRHRLMGVRAFAERHGFRHVPGDPFGLLYDYNFPLFEMGDDRGCENVVWGEWKGLPFKETDFWYYDDASNRKENIGLRRRFNAVVVDVPLYLPRVSVDPAGVSSVLAGSIGWHDFQFESGEFNRRFTVRAETPEFAFKLVDAQMMHWMLSTDERFGFQFYGSAIMVWSRKLRPTELLPLIGTAKELHDHIPRLVWKEFTTDVPRSAGTWP